MDWLATYILRGRVQAISVAAALAVISLFMPPVSIVSSATVALVTLRLGASEGFWVLACSSLIASLVGWGLLGSFQFALLYGLILWLPIWLIGIVLREGRDLSLAIEIAVLLGVVGVLGYYLYNPEAAAMWREMLKLMMPASAPIDAEQKIQAMSPYITGIAATGTVASLLLGLFLGRWWQALLYNPGGFRQEFLSLTAHSPVTFGGIAIVLLASVSSGLVSEVSWNLVIVLLVLYALIGSAVLHTILAAARMARYTVPMLYITLFLIPYLILPVAILGLLDKWLNLRKKYLKSNAP